MDKEVVAVARYRQDQLTPEDFLRFIQLGTFEEDWKRLGLDDDDLCLLERMIMRNPAGFPVIPGTGGLRKMRFASKRSGKGKRAGVRVGYAYFPIGCAIALLVAYSHQDHGDVTPEERRAIKAALGRIGEHLAKEN